MQSSCSKQAEIVQYDISTLHDHTKTVCFVLEIITLDIPITQTTLSRRLTIRPVTGEGEEGDETVCICWDIKSVQLFLLPQTPILQLGKVEHLKVRRNFHIVENHYFQFIHKI